MAKKLTAKKVAKKAPAKSAAEAPSCRSPCCDTEGRCEEVGQKDGRETSDARVSDCSSNPRTSQAEQASPVSVPPEVELANVDEQLVALLNKRTSLYLQKMKGVETPSKIVFSDLDQQQAWGMIERCNSGPLTSGEIKTVFRPLMSAARQRIKSIRVAYLGPAYSFTHQAAIARFGECADLVPVSTIATVFEEVNRGHVDFGLVPIENSTDGRIVDTLDMFTRLPLRICGEVLLACAS